MKKIQYIVFVVLACLYFKKSAFAQPGFSWVKNFGGPSIEAGKSIALDDSGNVYTMGIFSQTVDFDPGAAIFNLTSNGGMDVFITKYNSTGIFISAVSFGGTGDDFGNDLTYSTNSLFCSGSFVNTVDFDPGFGVSNSTSTGGKDMYLLKLDGTLNFNWSKTIGGTFDDILSAVTVDNLGAIYCTGSFRGTIDADPGASIVNHTSMASTNDVICIKLNNVGDYTTSFQVGGNGDDFPNDIMISSYNSRIYITGFFQNSVDFDPGPIDYTFNSVGNSDAFISCFYWTGAYYSGFSTAQLGGTGIDEGYYLGQDPDGNIYTTGKFHNTAIVSNPFGSPSNLISNGQADIFLTKYTHHLQELQWVKSIGGIGIDEGTSIVMATNYHPIIGGKFSNIVDFDPGAGTAIDTSMGNTDVFMTKFDSLGNYIWNLSFGGNSEDVLMASAGTNDEPIYSTGYFSGTCDFNPGSGIQNELASGIYNPYIVKLGTCVLPNILSLSLSDSIICPGGSTTLTINGTLNDATAWNIYSGSCNGTFVGNTSSNNFSLSPPNTTNYYIRAEGGCVGLGMCSIITVNVSDTILPVPTDAILNTISNPCVVTITSTPTATDNCAGLIIGTTTDPLVYSSQGVFTIYWTYSDGNGNITTQSQIIIVDDSIPPAPSQPTLTDITGDCNVVVSNFPQANDNCAGLITATTSDPLIYNTPGSFTINWIYNDGNGNITNQSQNVIVQPASLNTSVNISGTQLIALEDSANYQWLDCNQSFLAIPGETNQSFIPAISGNYAVIIQSGACSDTSTCYQFNLSSINGFENVSLKIYPNPVIDFVHINTNNGEIIKIDILSIEGQTILSQSNSTIVDLRNIHPGQYLMAIYTKEEVYFGKVIKSP